MNYINAINVFPVADGDTGRNMYRTISSVLPVLDDPDMDSKGVVEELSVLLLMNAMGNSGVIVSQIVRSILNFTHEDYNAHSLSAMFRSAQESAYCSVSHPIEGTMLTICRKAAEVEVVDNIDEYLMRVSDCIHESLHMTTSQLTVLESFGVVDSGAQGLVIIYDKLIDVFLKINRDPYIVYTQIPNNSLRQNATPGYKSTQKKYQYEIMFMCACESDILFNMRNTMSRTATSITVGSEGDSHSIHLHTDSPGKVIEIIYDYVTPYNLNIHTI